MKRSSFKRHIPLLAVIVFAVIGLTLLVYPVISNYLYEANTRQIISDYADRVGALGNTAYDDLMQAARQYNSGLLEHGLSIFHTVEKHEAYEAALDVDGTGLIGSLSIPILGLELPIYHGTDESVLRIGVGHMEGTSLPIGGSGTHAVLSAHSGMNEARMFTDLHKLQEGDTFTVIVLKEKCTYEVDQILTVEPHDADALQIEDGQDFCTLMTCTPFGVTTHRLLVRGHRVETANTAEGTLQAPISDSEVSDSLMRLAIAIVVVSVVAVISLILITKQIRKR